MINGVECIPNQGSSFIAEYIGIHTEHFGCWLFPKTVTYYKVKVKDEVKLLPMREWTVRDIWTWEKV